MKNFYNSNKLQDIFNKKSNKTYVIAEIGVNHNGNLDEALKLIDASVEANVDAVKFQKRDLKEIYSEEVLNDSNSQEWSFEYLIPLLKEVELTKDEYTIIRNYCDKKQIDLIITPFDKVSAKFVAELGISGFKISSSDMTNIDLIKTCNEYQQPMLISTGMWEEKDIKQCAKLYKKNSIENFAFLLAQSTYPAPYENLNLGFYTTLKELSSIVGYSGHERGTFIPIAAVAMGYQIIEKHITFNKEAKGPDHKASMYPEEFKEMVEHIRALESALNTDKKVNQAELQNKEAFAKSAVPIRDLPKDHVLIKADIIFKAPGKGIFPHEIDDYYGMILKKEVKKDHYINKTDFEDTISIKNWDKLNFSNDWGAKCRFHDYEKYAILNSPVIEFHCSQTDLKVDFKPKENSNSKLIIHAPEIFDRKLVDICSTDEEIVKGSLEILQETIDKTTKLAKYFPKAKPRIVMHLGGMFLNNKEVKDTYKLIDIAIENFKKLKYDSSIVEILPENLPPRPWYLGGEWYQHGFMSTTDMIQFCKEFDFKITFDICHAQLYCNLFNIDLIDYTKEIMPIVSHLHISDAYGTNGEGVQIDEGCIEFDRVFEAMKGYDFSWVSEIWSGHLHEGAGTYKCMKKLERYSHIL